MAKVILEFDKTEDAEEIYMAVNGDKFCFSIREIDQALRNMEKYKDLEVIKIEDCRSLIRQVLEDNGLMIDDL